VIAEVVRIGLAAVFVTGAIAKALDRGASRESLLAFGVTERAAGAVVWILIGSELVVGAALLLGPTATAGGAAALALLAVVTVAVVVNLIRGRTPECNCFGRLSRGPVGPATLARNGLFASLAGYVVAGGDEPALFAALALTCVAAWLALGPLRPRIRRGSSAPAFSLGDGGGAMQTLPGLLAGGRPLLLVFSQPACGACQALLGDLREWHRRLEDRVTIALVDQASHASGLGSDAERAADHLLLDATGAVASAYGVTATPSAVLIDRDGRMASAIARGSDEIEELIRARFADEQPRLARRALLVRAARGATTVGAFPLLAAACGSTSSSSRVTSSTGSTPSFGASQASIHVGGSYICRQKYALCTNAPCRPSAHDPNVVICDCVVKDGYSIGLTSCPRRAPHGNKLYSTFSTELATSGVRSLECGADIPWANCVDYPCELDPHDPTKATCQCALVKRGPSFTFGGECNTRTCGKTIWSGAHSSLGGGAVGAAMKRVGQPISLPPPCPKA
jgi:peroxiredoxin